MIKRSEPITTVIEEADSKLPKAVNSNIALPVVSYRGSRSRCDVAGLDPNSLYHFRLRYVGSRNNSQLSSPLVLMTTPLPLPQPPVMIRKGSTNVWVKWYPAPFGAFRFVVQLKVEAASSSSSSASNSNASGGANNGWKDVFNGPENVWKSTTMSPDTSYSLRVVGVNCQGAFSEPSPVLRFRTLPREEGKEVLTPRNASVSFTTECTGKTLRT